MTKQEIAEANRRRYEELRAAGQGATPKALPVATALDGAPLAPDAIVASETVPPGWYHTVRLRRGEALRIVDSSGCSSVSERGLAKANNAHPRFRGASMDMQKGQHVLGHRFQRRA